MRQHHCYHCQKVHPGPVALTEGHQGYQCPFCGVNLRWPTAEEIGAYDKTNWVFFGAVVLLILGIYAVKEEYALTQIQSLFGFLLLVPLWFWKQPGPIKLTAIDDVLTPAARARQTEEDAKQRQADLEVAKNIAEYRKAQMALKKNAKWWQFWR